MKDQTVKTELESYTLLFVRKFVMEYRQLLQSKMGLPVSNSVYSLLSILSREGVKKSSDLADALNITLPAVTSLTNKLVSEEFIERVYSEKDRRLVLINITPKGKELLDQIDKEAAGIVKRFWTTLSDDETQQLTQIFKKILQEDEIKENT